MKDLMEELSEKDARHIALMVFGTDEKFYLKKKGTFIEIRVLDENKILQIQDNGSMMFMTKNDSEFYNPITNCFQVVKYLLDNSYVLSEVKPENVWWTEKK